MLTTRGHGRAISDIMEVAIGPWDNKWRCDRMHPPLRLQNPFSHCHASIQRDCVYFCAVACLHWQLDTAGVPIERPDCTGHAGWRSALGARQLPAARGLLCAGRRRVALSASQKQQQLSTREARCSARGHDLVRMARFWRRRAVGAAAFARCVSPRLLACSFSVVPPPAHQAGQPRPRRPVRWL